MPSEFLTQRHRTFLAETSGTETITYYVFSNATKDSLTGDVTEASAYGTGIKIPARITHDPLRVVRDKTGQDIKADAFVRLAKLDCVDKEIIPKIGDAMIMPNETKKFYVSKVTAGKQSGTEFIEYNLTVVRKISGRGL